MQLINNSNFYEIIPTPFKNIQTQCLAYALSQAIFRLCQTSQYVRVLYEISGLPENILDYLAVEFRAQYYSQSMTRMQKVGIVESTLPWYMKSGTKGSLEKLLSSIYEESEVFEWFDYGGEPYHFKVKIGNVNIFDNEQFDKLLAIVQGAKNARSILDGISVNDSVISDDVYIAHTIQQSTANTGTADDFFIALGGIVGDGAELFIDGGSFADNDIEILDCGIF